MNSQPTLEGYQTEISEIARILWNKGWAERNAGNISVNVTTLATDANCKGDEKLPSIKLPRSYPALANASILISGTQTRMRHVAENPAATTCILRINANADAAMVRTCGNSPLKPSSEFPAHLAIHEMEAEKGNKSSVVVHTHPDDLIALTHIPQFKDEATLNKMLWSMHPETIIVLPAGVGFVPYTTPGTESLAQATIKSLKNHRVAVWEKHGVVATGSSLDEAFDFIDTAAKSAAIFIKCKAMGYSPEGLTDTQLAELKLAFGV